MCVCVRERKRYVLINHRHIKRTVVIRNKKLKLFQVGENGSRKTTLAKPHSQLMHITREQKHIPIRKDLMQ